MFKPAAPLLETDPTVVLAETVARGLALDPKRIPSRFLYDDLGSQLFEAICHLPWYRITRAERALLERHAGEILAGLGPTPHLIELGAGSGDKLARLLRFGERTDQGITIHLVDISRAALTQSTATLSREPGVTVVAHEAQYEVGLQRAQAAVGTGRSMVLFLGSNIGNLGPAEAEAFLRDIRRGCSAGDQLLLGVDLVKPEADLVLAYDDPLGITAAFNKNLLVRLNRELDGDFDVEAFDYRVVWNAAASRVESYLVSRADQLVCLRGAGCCVSFADGEPLWTESSHKYRLDDLPALADAAAFELRQRWVDDDAGFALARLEARPDTD